jgi:HEAT repeat protein
MSPTMAANWIKHLNHSDFCLQSWRNSPEAAADWLKDLDHPDPGVRAAAARLLGGLGATARPAVSRLTDLLGDGDPSVRSAAAHALEQIGRSPGAPGARRRRPGARTVLAALLLLGLVLVAACLLR